MSGFELNMEARNTSRGPLMLHVVTRGQRAALHYPNGLRLLHLNAACLRPSHCPAVRGQGQKT